jgi:hypothetical protein
VCVCVWSEGLECDISSKEYSRNASQVTAEKQRGLKVK